MADIERIHVVRLNPPLRQNYSIFMRNFQKNQHKIINYQVQFSNRTPLCKFEPLARNPGSAPASTIYFILFTLASPYGTHKEPGCTPNIWDPYRLLARKLWSRCYTVIGIQLLLTKSYAHQFNDLEVSDFKKIN